jgi:hypothetical protein
MNLQVEAWERELGYNPSQIAWLPAALTVLIISTTHTKYAASTHHCLQANQ